MGNIAHAPGFQEGCTKSLKLNAILVNSTEFIKEKHWSKSDYGYLVVGFREVIIIFIEFY